MTRSRPAPVLTAVKAPRPALSCCICMESSWAALFPVTGKFNSLGTVPKQQKL